MSKSKEALKITIICSEGLDILNVKGETMIDLKVYDTTVLSSLHQQIMKLLQLKKDDKYNYIIESNRNELDMMMTFRELGIVNNDKIYLESGKKRRKTHCNTQKSYNNIQATTKENIDEKAVINSYSSNILDLVCTTRIFDHETNIPIRKVRILVSSNQICKYLMDDVSELWDRTGLKFKCGRTVLYSDKTLQELGVATNSEIVVTGGRG